MKTVLITGVSTGIGYALADRFLKKGYRVIGSVRSKSKANELLEFFGENFYPLIFDLQNYNQIDESSEKIKEILGTDSLNGIINNAGSAELAPLLHLSMDEFKKTLDILVISQLYVIQKFYKYLIPGINNLPCGRIINISSISGEQDNYGFGGYSIGKHALEGLSKTLRKELNPFGIKLIVVGPGNVNTSIWLKQTYQSIEKYKDTIYYGDLKNTIDYTNSNAFLDNCISQEEFSKEFIKIFENSNPANRYTIRKIKLPFGKLSTKVWESDSIIDFIYKRIGKFH